MLNNEEAVIEGETSAATPPQSGSEQHEEAPSSGVKNDVTSSEEIPTHDDKGVPYYNRYREMEDRYKGIDLEKWKQLSDLDPDYYKEMSEFDKALNEDPALYKAVLETIKGYKKQGTPEGSSETKEGLPSDKFVTREEFDRIQARIQQEDANRAVSEYDSAFTKSIKDFDLDDNEKQILNKRVEDVFISDFQSGKAKLTLNDVSRVVNEEYKKIDDYRKAIVTKWTKKNTFDGAPAPIKGGSSAGVPGTKNLNRNDRVNAIREELKQSVS